MKLLRRFFQRHTLRLQITDDKYYVIHNGAIIECRDLDSVIEQFTGKGKITVIKGDMLDMSGYDLS